MGRFGRGPGQNRYLAMLGHDSQDRTYHPRAKAKKRGNAGLTFREPLRSILRSACGRSAGFFATGSSYRVLAEYSGVRLAIRSLAQDVKG